MDIVKEKDDLYKKEDARDIQEKCYDFLATIKTDKEIVIKYLNDIIEKSEPIVDPRFAKKDINDSVIKFAYFLSKFMNDCEKVVIACTDICEEQIPLN